MGGNGSFDKNTGGVPVVNRTHDELPNRIDGHKILVQKNNVNQVKLPMNSNSEKPMYLCASVDKTTKEVTIRQIGIYRNHKIVAEIGLEFDKKGNLIPYSKGKGSHMHLYGEDTKGNRSRKAHDKKNTFPVPRKYRKLLKQIELYNKERHTYDNK
ncbi:MAG: hypothetical protein IJ776_01365 [Paludibacteraceae bacterium]|nr:hypothetical protein [Paludibacteraceae bacterium]